MGRGGVCITEENGGDSLYTRKLNIGLDYIQNETGTMKYILRNGMAAKPKLKLLTPRTGREFIEDRRDR